MGESTVDAGTEVFIDRDRRSRGGASTASGEQWAWTETWRPDVDIEDRPLSEFLDWVARETGRRLVIADDATRGQVATIRTHGNVHGLDATAGPEGGDGVDFTASRSTRGRDPGKLRRVNRRRVT